MKNLIKNNLKQKIWLSGCITLMFILLRPMVQLITYENEKRFALTREALIQAMEPFFLPDFVTDMIPTAIAAVVIALVFFGYLFSKKQVDLYHSIPVDRKHLFAANYISGLIVYVFALIVEYLLCIIFAIPNHYMTGTAWLNLFTGLLINFVHFVFGYGVVILGIMLAGNAFVAFAGSAVIGLIFPAVASLLEYFEYYFYVTYQTNNKISPEFISKYYWMSPITSYATVIERTKFEWDTFYYADTKMCFAAMIMPAVMTIIVTAIAYLLYTKRPSEAAGRAIAFKKSRAFIEVPLVIISGLAGAGFMSVSVNTFKNSWIFIGTVIAAVLVHFILEAIFNESFRAIISHKLQLVVSLAIALVIIGVYYGDAVNYDKYIPKRESIKSAAVYFGGIDNSLSCLDFTQNKENSEYYIATYNDAYEKAALNRLTNNTTIDKIYGLSQIGISCVDDMIANRYNNNDSIYYKEATYENAVGIETEESYIDRGLTEDEAYEQAKRWMEENDVKLIEHNNERIVNVIICYELNSGKIVQRKYDIPLAKIYMAMNEVYKTDDYKKVHFDLINGFEQGVVYKVEVFDSFDNKVVSVTDAEKDKLLKTYINELHKLNLDVLSNAPIGRIAPLVKASEIYDESYSGYYLYPEFTETLALIESYGIDMSDFTDKIKAKDILALNVSTYDMYGYGGESGLYIENIPYDYESNEDYLKEIAPLLINGNNVWSNQLLIGAKTGYDQTGVDLSITMVPLKGIQRYTTVYFKDGKIPEKINRDIIIKLWEENGY